MVPIAESDTTENKSTEAGKSKKIYTTVAHVQTPIGERIFAGATVLSTCLLVMALLVANNMLGMNWTFFVDGQRSLQQLILRLFAWQGSLQLILDWHHVDTKCQEQLSRALNNRHARNDVLKELLRLLWYGNLDGAIAYLRQVEHKYVKSADDIEKLVGYFERNRQHIPCYAARKKLGLRNSSNRGEKANDLVVSFRQKHNGMSWSQQGSFALSTLDTLVRNDNHQQWFEERTVDFSLAA